MSLLACGHAGCLRAPSVAARRRWRSSPSGKCSQERLTRGTVTSTRRRAAHSSECARCGAGAGCSAIKYQFLSRPFAENPQSKPQTLNPTGDSPGKVFLPCASILCPRQRLPSKSLQGDYKTRILVEHLQRPDTTIFSCTMPWYNNI